MLKEFNTWGLDMLNKLTQYPIVETIAYIFADAPIFFLPLFLLSAWIYFGIKRDVESKKSLMYIFYGCVIAILISLTIQQFVHLERPEEHIKNTGKLLLNHIPDASFPSDHASVSFAFVTGLFLLHFRKTFSFFIGFVILMNISRIIAGVHWPLDILAGMSVGIISGYVSIYGLSKIKLVKKFNSWIIKVLQYIKL